MNCFGFKMHLIINEKGEVLSFTITPADVDDREPLKVKDFVKEIYGKLVGDKGYISKELFHELFVDGIQLITKVRNNMKNCLMSVSDKVLLRKRAVIESVNDELKNIAQLEHSRHRLLQQLRRQCCLCISPLLLLLQKTRNINRTLFRQPADALLIAYIELTLN